jgi:hypothetical protein
MKPLIVTRKGNKFVIDNTKLLPYLRKNKDLVQAAIRIACEDMKYHPEQYEYLDNTSKLRKLNDIVYKVLENWGIYKEI